MPVPCRYRTAVGPLPPPFRRGHIDATWPSVPWPLSRKMRLGKTPAFIEGMWIVRTSTPSASGLYAEETSPYYYTTHAKRVLFSRLSSVILFYCSRLLSGRTWLARVGTNGLPHDGQCLPWHCWREYPPRHEHTTIPSWPADDTGQHAFQRRA